MFGWNFQELPGRHSAIAMNEETIAKSASIAALPITATLATGAMMAAGGTAMLFGMQAMWLKALEESAERMKSGAASSKTAGTPAPKPAPIDAAEAKAATAPTEAVALERVNTQAEEGVADAEASPAAPAPAPAKPVSSVQPVSPGAVGTRPAGFEAPRGKPDDLKRISGIGARIEVVLNDLGIYHFDQIAAWSAAEIAWVDDYLKFKGRIARDSWVAQARRLNKSAAG